MFGLCAAMALIALISSRPDNDFEGSRDDGMLICFHEFTTFSVYYILKNPIFHLCDYPLTSVFVLVISSV